MKPIGAMWQYGVSENLASSLCQSQFSCMIVGRPFPFSGLFHPFNERTGP